MADDDNPLWSGLVPNLLTAWNAPNVRPQGNPLASAVMTNPVGTQYAGPSMGMPQGPFDPIVGMGANGVPITATQADAMRVRTQAGADVATTAVLGMTGDAPGKPPGFTAYHGSPHSFDAFDASKIGTGEGAQAYGHGLYVAGNEGVAQNYRDALRTHPARYTLDGKPVDAMQPDIQNDAVRSVFQRLYDTGTQSPDAALTVWQRHLKYADPGSYQHDRLSSDIETLQAMKDRIGGAPGGHMYEVQVNADPAHFLDWDRPLSEQTPHVQEALRQTGVLPNATHEATAGHFGYSLDEFKAMPADRQAALIKQTPASAGPAYQTNPTGAELHQSLSEQLAQAQREGNGWNSATGGPVRYDTQVHDPAAAAAALRDAGIPGIRYLDGGSRASGEGTHNHVIFDANTMAILRKYGIAGLMAGGAAAATQAPQQ